MNIKALERGLCMMYHTATEGIDRMVHRGGIRTGGCTVRSKHGGVVSHQATICSPMRGTGPSAGMFMRGVAGTKKRKGGLSNFRRGH